MNKKNIYLMYLIIFLQGFVFYGPVATIFREARGLSLAQIFFIESIMLVLTMLLEVPWGWFADKYGYKKTLIISNLVLFISKIIFFEAYSFWMFLLERILLGVAISGLSGCDSTVLYLSIDENENSEKVFARYEGFATSGFLIACLLSSYIISVSMDAAVFWTIIPHGLAVICTLFLDDVHCKDSDNTNIFGSIKMILQDKKIIIFIVALGLIGETVHSITVFLNQGQYLRSGIDIKYFGILLAIMQIVKLISVKSHKLSNKVGQFKAINILMFIIVIASFALIFTANPIISIVLIVTISCSMAFISPMAVDIQNKSIKSGNRATMLSIYSMVGSLLSAFISPIVGVASDISLQLGLAICCLLAIMAMIMMRLFIKYKGVKVNY